MLAHSVRTGLSDSIASVLPKPSDVDALLENNLNQYADWLAQAEPENDLMKQFRETWPQRFVELCKFHLSVLIDVPSDFYDEQIPTTTTAATDPYRPTPSRVPVSDAIESETVKRSIKPWQRLRHAGALSIENDASRSTIGHRHCRNPLLNSVNKPLVNEHIVENIFKLMDVLDTPENLSVEGIFRKTGNVVRQRLVRQRILSEKPLNMDALMSFTETKPWRPAGRIPTAHQLTRRFIPSHPTNHTPASPQINVHDLASGLKGVLYELPEPVLSHRLLPLFGQVAGLTSGRVDDRGNRVQLRPIEERIAAAKQLKALRLLCLLLPKWHCSILQRLLRLLQRTLDHSNANRMTAESLGTLFGPLLLSPGKLPTRDLPTQYNNLARLATTMIKQGVNGLWMVPRSFAQDVVRNYNHLTAEFHSLHPHNIDDQQCPESQVGLARTDALVRTSSDDSGLGWTEGSQPGSDADSCVVANFSASTELPALVTCINFAVRSKLEPPESDSQSLTGSPALGETEYAVAELCATVQALPDNDPRKRRLIQRFNATNGGLTPIANEVERRGGGFTRQGLPGCDASPGPLPFLRVNTGNSAFKAAKTIRSSLRRRLAIKTSINVNSCFEHHVFQKPLIEANQECDQPTPVHSQDKENKFDDQTGARQFNLVDSPIFECRPLSMEYGSCNSLQLSPLRFPHPTPETAVAVGNTRISLVSTASVSSIGATGGELFFCCPLVEALASPFRRRVGTGSHHTPDSTRSPSVGTANTPVSRVLRTGRKRLRCLSPPCVGAGSARKHTDESVIDESGRSNMATTTSTCYYPIAVPGVLSEADSEKRVRHHTPEISSTGKPPETPRVKSAGLWRMTTQTNLLTFGYRTVSQVRPKYRSSAVRANGLQRAETVPCLKSIGQDQSWLEHLRPCESMSVLKRPDSETSTSSKM